MSSKCGGDNDARFGVGNTVFDMPAPVSRIRVVAIYNSYSENFIMRVNGRTVVNELMGTAWGQPRYEGIHLLPAGGGVTEIRDSSGVSWEIEQIQ